jgi:asparagine synthase (glutamine-hydrolysing)
MRSLKGEIMTAIAGIAAPNRKADLNTMLQQLSYRGSDTFVIPDQNITLGIVLPEGTPKISNQADAFTVSAGRGHFVGAKVNSGEINLSRDPLGVCPLYYGLDAKGVLYFASEVKALLPFTDEVKELPPGAQMSRGSITTPLSGADAELLKNDPEEIAAELLRRLDSAVEVRAKSVQIYGALLSGGLDSTIVTALARKYTPQLHTYAAGLEGAPDLLYARKAASDLKCTHHERIVTLDEMLGILPDVIYHLESFDALLVRSSILQFAAAQMAAGTVSALFSGEGADELFAGYDYLKLLPVQHLAHELNSLTNRLHNTALQRVDRCIQAYGITGWVPLLDPQVVEYARRIPVDLKLHRGVEKWILRQASAHLLPAEIARRPKAKFWQGGGVGSLLSEYADQVISASDFAAERQLPNGWMLNTREELYYYRIFREHFGELLDLEWVGRTIGAPVQYPSN